MPLLVPILQGLVDGECPFFPIDGLPSQTDHFAGTQPGVQYKGVLIEVVRALGRLQKPLLFLNRKEMDIVHRSNRFGVPYAIHRMRVNHVVHLGRFEHGSHGNIGLSDGGTGVVLLHTVQHDFAVHRFHISEPHIPHDSLNVMHIAIPVISLCVGGQSLEKFCLPKFKPFIHCHIRSGDRFSVLILITGLFQPISCLGKRIKVVLHTLSTLGHKPRIV